MSNQQNCNSQQSKGEPITHQIMVIVGNGFDTSVLNKYGENITTSYDSFYRYFKYHYPNENDNIFIQQMEILKEKNKSDWSDFEAIISMVLQEINDNSTITVDKLSSDLSKLQLAFSRFLNEVVNNDIIKSLSEDTSNVPEHKNSLAYYSISEFLGDLSREDYEKNKFKWRVYNHDSIEMLFFNFNYTSLLDNYVYLDKNVFDPVKYKSGNNFQIQLNPKGYLGFDKPSEGYSKAGKYHNNPYCRLHTTLFHPHGFQNVPKSILFGTELGEEARLQDALKPFIKSYWAQCEVNYSKYFDDTSLFIIYGCSIGASDKWWWERIYDKVSSGSAELIIYNYGSEERDVVIDRFIESCGKSAKKSTRFKDNVYVINHGPDSGNNIVFLQLPE